MHSLWTRRLSRQSCSLAFSIWGAWSSVLTGTALTEDEVGIRTATLDDVVDAINGEADVFYIGKHGFTTF